MESELKRVRKFRIELEPLAYFYERFEIPFFKVCFDLFVEYRQLEEWLMKRAEEEAA